MTSEEALRRASALFHEIVGAHSARQLIGREREATQRAQTTRSSASMTEAVREDLRRHLRTSEQISQIAADGFELCVRALAAMGATDVSIHECSEKDLEGSW